MTTVPPYPSMIIGSPVSASRLTSPRPTTAGILRDRAKRAACDVTPPRSVAYPSTWFRLRIIVSAVVGEGETTINTPFRGEPGFSFWGVRVKRIFKLPLVLVRPVLYLPVAPGV